MKGTAKFETKERALSLVTDITYRQVPHWYGASKKDLKISVIYPKHPEESAPCPLILWICGGGFRTMDRNVWLPQMMHLARKGYVIASPEYRTTNEVTFPKPLEDIKAAICYMKDHASQFAVDREQVFVMGESAGGTLAVLAAVTAGCAEYEPEESFVHDSSVKACVDFYGVTDFQALKTEKNDHGPEQGSAERFLGTHEYNAWKASAVNYIKRDTPPILILHGTEDELVDIEQQSLHFYEKLQRNEIKSGLIMIEGGGHGDDVFYQDEVLDIIDDFLRTI